MNTQSKALSRGDFKISRSMGLIGAIATAAVWIGMLAQNPPAPGHIQHSATHVNRVMPDVAAPSRGLEFSDTPDDSEFLRAGVFDQPLLPVGHSHVAENRALARSLVDYHNIVTRAAARDNVDAILGFLSAHPTSVWRPALLIELGAVYRETGHFSKALDTYTQAWAETRSLNSPNGRILGDMAAAQLSQFEAYLGRTELLAPLLDDIKGRAPRGTAAELISDSSRGLGEMRTLPQFSFRCGPMALARILFYHGGHPSPDIVHTLDTAYSTDHGLSMNAVREVSVKVGMNYQMAFRQQGAAIVYPAVVHWKLGHYAAIVDEAGSRYVVEDSTFGPNVHISAATLDEEASGYFLIPPGPLPQGWRAVGKAEGDQVWGRGNTGSNTDFGDVGAEATNAFSDYFYSNSDCFNGCTSWNVEAMVVGLALRDQPAGYTPPVGPAVQIKMQYSQRDALQPMAFSYTNFGNKWTFNWLSYITDKRPSNGTVDLYERGGGDEPYTFATGSPISQPGIYSQSVITAATDSNGNTTGFTRQLSDGSTETFSQPMGNLWFLTAVTDPRGNAVTLTYDSQFRIVALKDAIGQVTTLSYNLPSDPLKVTQITDPFGRSASFAYTADGHLTSITDVLGITSAYTYGTGDFINSLVTPYGTTTFTYGDSTTDPSLANLGSERFVTATDTLSRTSRVEFRHQAPGITSACNLLPNIEPSGMPTDCSLLEYRNTFIWNPAQLQLAMGSGQGGQLDYTKAKIIHWLHTAPDLGLGDSTSRVIESVVPAQASQSVENRVWYSYAGQQAYQTSLGPVPASTATGSSNEPTAVGRALNNGTELQQFTYNAFGRVTQEIDPVGRQTRYAYASNGIDLLSVANTSVGTNQLLASYTYNGQHEPVTITGANGATANFKYNAAGQPTAYTDQLGNTTTYLYDSQGYLTHIQGPVAGASYSFTYDGYGRVASATDPAGMTVDYTYDSGDRLTRVTFPDGTSVQYAYHLLDLVSSTDRLGQRTSLTFDTERELTQLEDPSGHSVGLAYCPCGLLSSITDPNGNVTSLSYDAEDRLTQKKYADASVLNIQYEIMSGRVTQTSTQSANGQSSRQVSYTYNLDGSLSGYTATGAATAAVARFSYDTAYPRLTSVVSLDSSLTTTLTYYPVTSSPQLGANQLQSISSTLGGLSLSTGATGPDTVTYTYDALDRVVGEKVNGAAQTTSYDPLGRVVSEANPLDTFNYAYADATARVTGVTSAHGPAFNLSYQPPSGDELLKQVQVSGPGGVSLSQFSYTHNADDVVTSFSESYVGQTLAATTGNLHTIDPKALAHLSRGGWASGAMGPHYFPDGAAFAPTAPAALAVIVLVATCLALVMIRRLRIHRLTWTMAPALAALLILGCGGGGDSNTGAGGGGSTTAPGGGGPTATGLTLSYAYDTANQLISATPSDSSAPFAYAYDAASNITSITTGGQATAISINSTNALSNSGDTYDTDGNPTTLGAANYTWDALNRLVSVSSGTSPNGSSIPAQETDFGYDGLDHLVRILQKQNGQVVGDLLYFWCGAVRCLEHDNTQSGAPVSKQYFAQGVISTGTPYYYVTDYLGTVRQLVDASGAVRAQYEYDPYGVRTKISGDQESDLGYGGYFHESSSGLDFALYRAYAAPRGRWLNRDPSGESGGLNLYGYANANPTTLTDPTGLDCDDSWTFEIPGPLGTIFGPGIQNVANFVNWMAEAQHPQEAAEIGVSLATGRILTKGVSAAVRQWVAARKGLAAARAARDSYAEELVAAKRRDVATVTGGYNVRTGEVAAKGCGNGMCAEDHVLQELGGNKANVRFTEAIRPRTMKQVPVCERCETSYGRKVFPPGTLFKGDGL